MRVQNEIVFPAVLFLAMSTVLFAAEPKEEKEPPKPDDRRAPIRMAAREQNPEWVAAMERLRLLPRAGEIKNVGVTANISDIYDLNASEKAGVAKIQEEFEAALIQRAAKWEEEEKALRAEYEQKLIEALPAAKRENSKKILDFSHTQWVGTLDREARLKRETLERAKAQKTAQQTASVDQLREGRAEMMAWIREQRSKAAEQDEKDLKAIKALMDSDESARLDQANRNRLVQPQR